jgi:hypothetical protein
MQFLQYDSVKVARYVEITIVISEINPAMDILSLNKIKTALYGSHIRPFLLPGVLGFV